MRTVAILSFYMQMSSSRWLLFSCLMGLGSCLSCPGWPCNPAEHCTGIDLSNCRYGVVKDTCHCCDVCGLGPGETCGLEGRCGAGMECVKDAPDYITGADLDQYPGECITATSTTGKAGIEKTTEKATEGATLGVTEELSEETVTEHSIESNCTYGETTTETTGTCREKCSIDFCTGSSKARICSAAGLEFSRIEGRGQCQHTSCKSCFLLTQPTCDTVCPDPPKKRCLRQFFNCVLQHFFNRTTTTPNHLLVSIAKKDAYWP